MGDVDNSSVFGLGSGGPSEGDTKKKKASEQSLEHVDHKSVKYEQNGDERSGDQQQQKEASDVGSAVLPSSPWKKKSHVLVVSVAFPGHFAPFVQILFHLDARAREHPGLTVTVMGNKDRIAELVELRSNGAFEHLDLRLEEVFGPVPIYNNDPTIPVRAAIVTDADYRECEPFRTKLISQKGAPGAPTAVIADMFQCWSKDLADELGVPWYSYFSTCPIFAALLVEFPKLKEAGVHYKDSPDVTQVLSEAVPDLIDLPGWSSIRLMDLPSSFFTFREFYANVAKSTIGAAGILLNICEEMDGSVGAIPGLRTLIKSSRVISIGPSLQQPGFGSIYTPTDRSRASFDWLNSQSAKSVIYISFGSLGIVSKEAIFELAAGIEASGVPFLWALKLQSAALSDSLPSGFQERTRGRGFIDTGWVPQSKILLHPAVGGFLSHCGWNSTLESICTGVPIVAWSLGADQHVNARFLADVAKVAIAVCYQKDKDTVSFEDIDARAVERSVRLLMLEEEGRQVRANMEEMQKSIAMAVAKGGSSHRNLHTWLDELVGRQDQWQKPQPRMQC